jgi:hypothetical protein
MDRIWVLAADRFLIEGRVAVMELEAVASGTRRN